MVHTFDSLPEERALEGLTARAEAIEREDKALCSAMADHGADLFKGRKNLRILTHCNTGALATAGIGTASMKGDSWKGYMPMKQGPFCRAPGSPARSSWPMAFLPVSLPTAWQGG